MWYLNNNVHVQKSPFYEYEPGENLKREGLKKANFPSCQKIVESFKCKEDF